MNRKKAKRRPSDRSPEQASAPSPSRAGSKGSAAASGTTASTTDRDHEDSLAPSGRLRMGLSVWVVAHLFALLISFTSVVEPSEIHANLAALFHPYLRLAHFAADDRPVYLAHGTPSEQPHRLLVTEDVLTDLESVDECQWQMVGSGSYTSAEPAAGLAVSDRAARWLSTAATLAENDQPSMVAELLLPIAQHLPESTAIRIVRLPTDLSDVNAEAESPYVAHIVRSGDEVSLVQLTPARLSSHASPEARSDEQ